MDEFDDDIITLTSEYGTEENFILLDLVEYNDSEYLILLPVEDQFEDEAAVVILKIVDTGDGETEEYVAVDDEDILSAVFDIFKERNEEEFDFDD